jgi:hypothetical protein
VIHEIYTFRTRQELLFGVQGCELIRFGKLPRNCRNALLTVTTEGRIPCMKNLILIDTFVDLLSIYVGQSEGDKRC